MTASDPFDLTGRLVVTGIRRGIGFAMATALARAGADIVEVSAHAEPDGGELGRAPEPGREFTAGAPTLVSRRR